MIIWLASYPKSGNTWVRSFLTSIFFSEDGNANLADINNIKQFPLRSQFENFVKDFENIDEIVKNWTRAQDLINLDNKIKFLKTHQVNCKFGEYQFTNLNNSLGTIHIVRDPRNVITSIKNHFSLNSYEEAKKFIFKDDNWIGILKNNKKIIFDNKVPTLISSWKNHYISWKDTTKNYLLIKYEDLINNPVNEFNKIVSYLEKILNTKIDKKKVDKAIESTSFKNFQNQEDQGLFNESVEHKFKKEKKKFFYLGPNNNWQKLLDKNICSEIENENLKEMKELKYLN